GARAAERVVVGPRGGAPRVGAPSAADGGALCREAAVMSLSEEEMREMHRAIFPAAEALGKLGQTTNPAVGIARCVREVTRATEQVGATLRSISLPSPAILAQVARAARMMEEA